MADPTPVVRDFPSVGWLQLKITIGELITSGATLLAAFWITKNLQRRHAHDQATRELMIGLCQAALDELGALSAAVADCCPGGVGSIETTMRQKIRRHMQRFSNSVHTIESTASKAGLKKLDHRVTDVKDHRQTLQAQITDPLVTDPGFDANQLRQIEGTVLQTRESLISLQLAIIQH